MSCIAAFLKIKVLMNKYFGMHSAQFCLLLKDFAQCTILSTGSTHNKKLTLLVLIAPIGAMTFFILLAN